MTGTEAKQISIDSMSIDIFRVLCRSWSIYSTTLLLLFVLPLLSRSQSTELFAVSTFVGRIGVSGAQDGFGTAALFNGPVAISYHPRQDLFFVVDQGNNLLRSISPTGLVSTFAGGGGMIAPGLSKGYRDGEGTFALFNDPEGLTISDYDDCLYIVERGNHLVRKINMAGTVTTFAGGNGTTAAGLIDGVGTFAMFSGPYGVTSNPMSGNLFVADTANALIRHITPEGVVSTFVGSSNLNTGAQQTVVNSVGTYAFLPRKMFGIAFNTFDNNLYVTSNEAPLRVYRIDMNGVFTAFVGFVSGSRDGFGTAARFARPFGISCSPFTGNVFVSDEGTAY